MCKYVEDFMQIWADPFNSSAKYTQVILRHPSPSNL